MTDLDAQPVSDATNGTHPGEWTDVCPIERIPLDRGVAALVDGLPVAIFRLSPLAGFESAGSEELFAVSHIDPATGSPVMARGLVGSAGAPPVVIPTVASPLHKQRYNLRTGACLDDEKLHLEVFDVETVDADGTTLVRVRPVATNKPTDTPTSTPTP